MKKKLFLASLIYIYIYSVTPQNAYAIKDSTSFNPEPVKVEAKNNSVPIGTVIVWTKDEIPEGWLECNGQAVNQDLYPDLFVLMHNVPDYRDRFLQGTNNEIVGKKIEAGLPNITGSYDNWNNGFSAGLITEGAFKNTKRGRYIAADIASLGSGINVQFDASLANSIYGNSSTVQPPAVTVKYIIKAE